MSARLVIYTCITGGYDTLSQPSALCPGADYICFIPSGEPHPQNAGIWQIREFSCPSCSLQQQSRYPKMMPHIFLKNYDYSLYVDASIDVLSEEFYGIVLRKMDEGSVFSACTHPVNDCVYDEAYSIIHAHKDSLHNVLRTLRFLKNEDFPRHYGLYENGLLLRKHGDSAVVEADELWWRTFLTFPKRDQLTLGYCLWTSGLKMDYLLGTENLRTSPLLKLSAHKDAKSPSWLCRKLGTIPQLIVRIYSRL